MRLLIFRLWNFPKKLSWRGIEPGTFAWEATTIPTEPQRHSDWIQLKPWVHSYLACEIFSGLKTLFWVHSPCQDVRFLSVYVTHYQKENFEKITGNWTPDVCMSCQYTTKWAIQDFQFECLFYQISALKWPWKVKNNTEIAIIMKKHPPGI